MTRAFVGVARSLCKVVDARTAKRSSSQKVHARARSSIIEDSSRIRDRLIAQAKEDPKKVGWPWGATTFRNAGISTSPSWFSRVSNTSQDLRTPTRSHAHLRRFCLFIPSPGTINRISRFSVWNFVSFRFTLKREKEIRWASMRRIARCPRGLFSSIRQLRLISQRKG